MNARTPTDPAAAAPPSDAWRPAAPGDQLVGVVTDIDTAWSKFRAAKNPEDPDAGWYPLLTVLDDGGDEFKVHGFRTVLYNEILRKKPIAGERVAITFVGVAAARDGMNGAHVYRVKVHGRSASGDAYQGMRPASGPSGGGVTDGDAVPVGVGDDDEIPY